MILATLLSLVPAADAAVQGWVKASSEKVDREADMAWKGKAVVDGLLGTSWAEDEDGYGEGSWVEIDLGTAREVQTLSLWPGNLSQGEKSFKEYSRPRVVRISLHGAGKDGEVVVEKTIEDKMQRLDVEVAGKGRKLRIEVLEVYEGIVFSDLHIAEVALDFDSSDDKIQKLVEWYLSDKTADDYNIHETGVKALYGEIKAQEFGDDESLKALMDMAADGPVYVREQLSKLVDVGYRASAVKPDQVSVEAILKLKDPNAIPALELARLRSTGPDAAMYAERVEIFRAYQELIGGGSFSIPPWGDEGWERGALQSFGEPLPVEADADGLVYVADIGNSRVQRFRSDGVVDRQWGPDADITNVWLQRGRPWYVSGAGPGNTPGTFSNPLDLVLMPDKKLGTYMAVLDSNRRVQVFDAAGNHVVEWTVDTTYELEDGVGGEAYIAWIPKKKALYVVWGDELFAYAYPTGEPLGSWTLKDGVPHAVEATKNGKLMMAYGQQIILYDLDGFRHGTILDNEQLGTGFEDMDITLDENQKLWVVTDQGIAYKFKPTIKGTWKVDYAARVSRTSLNTPRVAVHDEIIYCVDNDRIIRLDALQAKMDADAEAAANAL